jgi:nucleotide-binding universal stress UspA family protein
MSNRGIVVGTDGTGNARAAVRWAAHEAARRQVPLRIVHAFDCEWDSTRTGEFDPALRSAELITTAALDEARAIAPWSDIEAVALAGDAATLLIEAAHNAALVVLGNRGRGSLASALRGSVGRRVTTHATGPVVIVRGHNDGTDGPVVVGVDDSDVAEIVLAAAFQAAADRGSGLVVLRSFLPPVGLWVGTVPAAGIATPQDDAIEHAGLVDLVRPWRDKFPQVPVDVVVTHATAAAALTDLSHRARMVVVGSHGHGPVTRALLGSTSLYLLHHAGCPVLIVRPGQAWA